MGGMFSSKPKMPKPPEPTPMADEEAIKRAKTRTGASMRARSGRQSTILSEGEKLGG